MCASARVRMRACEVWRYWTRIASAAMMEAVRGRRQTRTELQPFELGTCPTTLGETLLMMMWLALSLTAW